MSLKTSETEQKVNDILAEVRALKYAVIHNAIPYGEAKNKAEVLLQKVNAVGERIAKKYGFKYKNITFATLK